MKLLKAAFLLALFNYFVVGGVVLAFKSFPNHTLASNVPAAVISVNPDTPLPTATSIPTATPRPLRRPTATPNPDPFAAVFNGVAPTSTSNHNSPPPTPPPSGGNNNSVPTPTTQSAPTPDTRCIITIDGSRYDVTVFRTLHSGGNIFQCGADMSSVFHAQHPSSYLSMMAQYKI